MKLLLLVFLSTMIFAGCGGGYTKASADLQPEPGSLSFPQEKVVETALNLLGVPYRYGGTTPEKGFDCSGYVAYVYKQSVGKSLPRRTAEQIRSGKALSPAKVGPGDLLYFWIEEQRIFHVGISIGGGRFIHAPSRKGEVRIQQLHDPYWEARYRGARRVL